MLKLEPWNNDFVCAEYSRFHVGRREGEQGASQVYDKSFSQHQKHVPDT